MNSGSGRDPGGPPGHVLGRGMGRKGDPGGHRLQELGADAPRSTSTTSTAAITITFPRPPRSRPTRSRRSCNRATRPGAYNLYGPRVPAVVVSPYSAAGGVTSVIHDHTSVLATIEAKWNLPALTNRDANAHTVMDFLDLDLEAPNRDQSRRAVHARPVWPSHSGGRRDLGVTSPGRESLGAITRHYATGGRSPDQALVERLGPKARQISQSAALPKGKRPL